MGAPPESLLDSYWRLLQFDIPPCNVDVSKRNRLFVSLKFTHEKISRRKWLNFHDGLC